MGIIEEYEKRIYFIGGYLDKGEVKKDFEKYKSMLSKVWINEAVRDMDLLNHPIISVPQCTKEQLEWIWKDKHTYGIIWYSHGDQDGYPLAYHATIDEPWLPQLSNKEKASLLRLDPKNMWKPGSNLKFVAFQSCYSEKLHKEWQTALPGIEIKTHAGRLIWTKSQATNVPVDQMKMWIDEEKIWSCKPAKPTDGARYLFRYLIDVSQKPTSRDAGSRDAGVSAYGSDEEFLADLRPQQASVIPDLSERIKILPDSGELPQEGWQNRQASVIPDLSERIKILPDSEEREPFQPFEGQSMAERFGADRLVDSEEREPFQPFEGQSMAERFGADRLRDFPGHEEREPFQPFKGQSMAERFGADRLRDFHEEREPFAGQSMAERFGADRLRDFPGHEPFQISSNQPQWMNQGFGGPPQFGSQVDLRPQKPFTDKPQWKS